MVNTSINISDVTFDEELLGKDEWLQVMQQKHHIDMMLFGETVEGNLFAAAQVNTKVKKTDTEIEAKAKKEAQKEKIETDAEAATEKEAQQEKTLIAERKEQNQCGSADVFTYN